MTLLVVGTMMALPTPSLDLPAAVSGQWSPVVHGQRAQREERQGFISYGLTDDRENQHKLRILDDDAHGTLRLALRAKTPLRLGFNMAES